MHLIQNHLSIKETNAADTMRELLSGSKFVIEKIKVSFHLLYNLVFLEIIISTGRDGHGSLDSIICRHMFADFSHISYLSPKRWRQSSKWFKNQKTITSLKL